MLGVAQCFCTAICFRMKHWATHKLRCCDPFPLKAFSRRDEEGKPPEFFKSAVETKIKITISVNRFDSGQRNGPTDALFELWSHKHYFGTQA